MTNSGDPLYRAYEQERGERWMRGIFTVLALASAIPTVQVLADRLRPSLAPRLTNLGSWIETQEGNDVSAIEAGMYTVVLPVLAMAIGLFFWLMRSRERDSQRTVQQAIDNGSVPHSPMTIRLTALAWTQLLVFVTACGTMYAVATGPTTSADMQRFIDNPAWALLTVVGAAGMTAFSYWYHRRVHQLEPSGAVRTATERHTERASATPTFQEGTRLYGKAMIIEGGFGVAAFGQGTINGTLGPAADFSLEWLIYALLAPAVLSGSLLTILFIFRPTRWVVDDALSQPTTKLALGLILGGVVTAGFASVLPAWIAVIAILTVLAGAFIAGATGLYVQDLGPQPLLGSTYLIMLYVFSAFGTEQGDIAPPAGPFAWTVALALGVFLIRELHGLWRDNYDRPAAAPRPETAPIDLRNLPPPTPKPGS